MPETVVPVGDVCEQAYLDLELFEVQYYCRSLQGPCVLPHGTCPNGVIMDENGNAIAPPSPAKTNENSVE